MEEPFRSDRVQAGSKAFQNKRASEVLNANALHVLGLERMCDTPDDVAAEFEIDGNVWVLMSFIDTSANTKLDDIAVEEHTSEPDSGVGLLFFGINVRF